MERYLHKGLCVDACPETFYHAEQNTCEPCTDHCQRCTGPDSCLKCNSSHYVSDGRCVKLECGEGKQGRSVVAGPLSHPRFGINSLDLCLSSLFLQMSWKIQIMTIA